MIIPVIVTGVGLILLFLPVRRSRREAVPGGVRGAWPELPPNHVVRPELLGRLRAALLDGTGGGPRWVGVWGMGGSGKSVLAAALRQDRAVRRRFPDGLAWVRLEPPDDPVTRRGVLAQRQQELVAKLTPAGQVAGEVTDVEQGRDRLAELLRDRACLVVVDNVWTADDVYAFSVLDRRGVLLVTTRNAGLVRAMGADEVEVAELSDTQARTLAADWAKVPEQSLPPPAEETLRLVGNLALGVATVAALARGDGQRWAELADRLRRAELAAFELRFPGYPHPSLLAALQLGLDYLDPSDRQRYRELAVFAGRGAVPRSAVEALWAPVGCVRHRCRGPAREVRRPGAAAPRSGHRPGRTARPAVRRRPRGPRRLAADSRTNSCWLGTRPAARAAGRPGRMTATSTSTWPGIWPRPTVGTS